MPATAYALDSSVPLYLDDPSAAWRVTAGEVDLFVVPVDAESSPGRRYFVGSLPTGSLLLGAEPQAGGWCFVAVGVEAEVTELPEGWAKRLASDNDVSRGLHRWLHRIAGRLQVAGRVLAGSDFEFDADVTVAEGEVVGARREVAWFRAESTGFFVGAVEVPVSVVLPVCGEGFLTARTAATGAFVNPAALSESERVAAVRWLTDAVLTGLVGLAEQRNAVSAAREVARRRQDEHARADAMNELGSIGKSEQLPSVSSDDAVLAACQLLGELTDTPITAPADWSREDRTDHVRAIARASGVRVRAVTLAKDWQRRAFEPMVAFRAEHGEPVVVTPERRGYLVIDPVDGSRTKLTRAQAADLRPTGYQFYPPLPPEGVGVRELLSFGLRGGHGDLTRMLVYSLIAGALSLAVPIATGAILGSLVPQGETGLIIGASVVLFLVVFASTGFLLARSGGLLRVQGRMLTGMQAGLWDRLIALPAEFFRRFSVADLSLRVTGVEMIQQIVASVASQTLLGLVTLAFSLALLFSYDTGLATFVLVVTLVVVVISSLLTVAQIRRLRAMYDAKGEASAVLLQLVQGIDKVRAAAAENRALDAWSSKFARQARQLLASQRISAVRTAIYAALPVLLTLTVFTVVGNNPDMMSTAAFLSFTAALAQIASATNQLDLSVGYALNIVPIFDRMRPVLTEPVEITPGSSDPGLLSGKVALSNVSFHYPGMTSEVLSELNLEIEPGEFVAIVGPSGSGKSTLVRLLLGFERPNTGTVTFDGKDLTSLDVRAVRAQIGVAMQNAAVTGGDILSAIRGDWPLTEAQAWQAAAQVDLADDIRALPMGMRTLLGDNAVTFSGGQRQRLVLASVIARNPRLVLLDEATSALDSVTQAHVARSFEKLQVTRVVVAHRLSTIRNADRIVVLDGGRLVQQGSYAELAAQPGVFSKMVRRQTL